MLIIIKMFYLFYHCSGEDAEDDTNEENPFADLVAENENLYLDDPKKAIKGFYEREGNKIIYYYF